MLFLLTILALLGQDAAPALRPFADYQDTGYVVLSALDGHGANELKREIARHLPDDVTLVLYGPSEADADRQAIVQDYARFIAADRIVYLALPRARDGFWTRDSLPMPSFDEAGRLVLTDARYWTGFEPDGAIGARLGATMLRHPFKFEGGNLMANHLGDCFVVHADATRHVPDAVFASHYGCRTLVRLPQRGGIGHIDERARFVKPRTILTDTLEYEALFVSKGFQTARLPRPANVRETYVNALIVNGTAMVPQFAAPEDAEALRVYRRLGFTVVGLDARVVSQKGRGAIHCLTMNYPRVPLAETGPLRRPSVLP